MLLPIAMAVTATACCQRCKPGVACTCLLLRLSMPPAQTACPNTLATDFPPPAGETDRVNAAENVVMTMQMKLDSCSACYGY